MELIDVYKMARNITEINVQKLAESLSGNNMQEAHANDVIKSVQNALNSDNAVRVDKDTRLYRCRGIDFDGKRDGIDRISNEGEVTFSGYNEYASREAPLGLSGAGRNNIKGVSYLYLAEDEYTACAEIKPYYCQFVSVAEFVVQKPLRIIDFEPIAAEQSDDTSAKKIYLGQLFAVCSSYFSRPPYAWQQAYTVCQFLSEMVRKSGYDGIRYKSMYSGKYNYTLFHFSDVYIRYKKSKPLYVQHSCLDIYDINAKLMVEKPSISSLMDEPKHIEDILSRDICKWKERDDKR